MIHKYCQKALSDIKYQSLRPLWQECQSQIGWEYQSIKNTRSDTAQKGNTDTLIFYSIQAQAFDWDFPRSDQIPLNFDALLLAKRNV